jgi:biotin transport system substrate-specific component
MTLKEMTSISLFTALTIVMSLVIIPLPFTPVPITGQTIAVLLSGALLGSRRGVLSQVVYMLIGIAGLPVFAGMRGGPGVILGPTGGFIWGFILMSYVIGKIIETGYKRYQRHNIIILLMAFFTGGILILYTAGAIQLAIVLKIGIAEAFAAGVLPFMPGEFLKIIMATLLAIKLIPMAEKLGIRN